MHVRKASTLVVPTDGLTDIILPQAHTDDTSDPELTAAMEAWFDNYDTSEPFTGQLYYPGASAGDDGLRTSSILGSITDQHVRVGFDEFSFGEQGAMLGPMPDMDKESPS